MDPFEELQNTIQQVLPIVLVGPGLVLAGCGLFMWLGGLRWLKAIAAFSATLAGLAAAWFFTEHQLAAMVLFPVILAGLGIYFHKLVVVLLGAVLAAVIVLLGPELAAAGKTPQPDPRQPAAQEQLNLLESVEWVETKFSQLRQSLKEMISSIPASRKHKALMTAVIVCVWGLFSWRMVCAATCSVFGVSLIFSGMTVLMLYKGPQALAMLIEKRQVLTMAAVGMVLAGVMIQVALCPKKKKVTKDDVMKEILNEGGKK